MLGLPFTCIPADIDETPPEGLSPLQVAGCLALQKTLTVADNNNQSPWVFGADTIVVLDNKIYGKPSDRNEARRMLEKFSGRRHEVITAMALHNNRLNTTDCRSVRSEVVFASLSNVDIDWYLNTGEWEGAAGAYQLQGLGACLISSINGSPSAVAGLPLHEFYAMLRDNGCY